MSDKELLKASLSDLAARVAIIVRSGEPQGRTGSHGDWVEATVEVIHDRKPFLVMLDTDGPITWTVSVVGVLESARTDPSLFRAFLQCVSSFAQSSAVRVRALELLNQGQLTPPPQMYMQQDHYVFSTLTTTGIVKVIHPANWQDNEDGGETCRIDVEVNLEDDLIFQVIRETEPGGIKKPWRVEAKGRPDSMFVGQDLTQTFLACVNKVAKEPIIRAKVSELIGASARKVTLTPTVDTPPPNPASAPTPAPKASDNDRFISALGSIHPRERAKAIVRVRDHLASQFLPLPAGDSVWPIKGWRIAEDGEAADVILVHTYDDKPHPFVKLVEVEILDQYHVAARLRVATSEKPGMGFVQLTVAEARGKTTEEAATEAVKKLGVILRALSGC